jgi:hypothetical protein
MDQVSRRVGTAKAQTVPTKPYLRSSQYVPTNLRSSSGSGAVHNWRMAVRAEEVQVQLGNTSDANRYVLCSIACSIFGMLMLRSNNTRRRHSRSLVRRSHMYIRSKGVRVARDRSSTELNRGGAIIKHNKHVSCGREGGEDTAIGSLGIFVYVLYNKGTYISGMVKANPQVQSPQAT